MISSSSSPSAPPCWCCPQPSFFLPYRSPIDRVTNLVNYHHLAVNIIMNFLLVIVFFYFILRLLDAKEQKTKIAAAAKARFMSNMSHELRTPLNAIIGTTHLLVPGPRGFTGK